MNRTLAPWIPSNTPLLNADLARRALLDIGIVEIPPGSNRSTRIDEYVQDVGSPLGSYWCAAAVSAWFRESNAKIPPTNAASCDAWMEWAKKNNQWFNTPIIGSGVVYGKPGDAHHIGVIVRTDPLILSVEGNASLGGEFSRNGVAVDLKLVDKSRVLGYIYPTPRT